MKILREGTSTHRRGDEPKGGGQSTCHQENENTRAGSWGKKVTALTQRVISLHCQKGNLERGKSPKNGNQIHCKEEKIHVKRKKKGTVNWGGNRGTRLHHKKQIQVVFKSKKLKKQLRSVLGGNAHLAATKRGKKGKRPQSKHGGTLKYPTDKGSK